MGKRKSPTATEQGKDQVKKLLKEIEKRVRKQPTTNSAQVQELEKRLVKILDSIPETPQNHECCMLPHHHHPLKASRRVCAADSTHVFCKRHRLDNCVICGGDLN
jgi:hypothetical protein